MRYRWCGVLQDHAQAGNGNVPMGSAFRPHIIAMAAMKRLRHIGGPTVPMAATSFCKSAVKLTLPREPLLHVTRRLVQTAMHTAGILYCLAFD